MASEAIQGAGDGVPARVSAPRVEDWFDGLVRGGDGVSRPAAASSAAISYPEHGNRACLPLEDGSFWFRHRNACIAAMIRRHPPTGPIFDIGGGNGCVARYLIDNGLPTILVEPGEDGARVAAGARRVPAVICARFEDLPPARRALPAVALFDVLEHIEDDGRMLAELAARLEEGGMLYLAVPAHARLWSQSDTEAHHFRRYDRAGLERVFAPHFDIVYFTYFFRFLAAPIFLLRTLPYLLGFRSQRILRDDAEHGVSSGPAARTMDWLAARERRALERGPLAWGASCLLAARKRRPGAGGGSV